MSLVRFGAALLLRTTLLGEDDGLREDLEGVRNGSSSSSKSMESPCWLLLSPLCTWTGLASSSLSMRTRVLRLTRDETEERSGKVW